MIRTSVRAASAAISIVLFVCAAVLSFHEGITPPSVALALGAMLLLMPAFASSRPPALDELAPLTENLDRFRNATIVCFAVALWLYLAVASTRANDAFLQDVASLGAAFWCAGFLVLPFAAYFGARRRMLLREIEE